MDLIVPDFTRENWFPTFDSVKANELHGVLVVSQYSRVAKWRLVLSRLTEVNGQRGRAVVGRVVFFMGHLYESVPDKSTALEPSGVWVEFHW